MKIPRVHGLHNRSAYSRVCDQIDALLSGLAFLSLALIVTALAAQVIFRYVLGTPLSHTDEIAQVALTWLTFTGAASLYRRRGHIEIDVITGLLPHRAARLVAIVVELAVLTTLLLVVAQIVETKPVMERVIYGTLQRSKFTLQFLPLLLGGVATVLFGIEALLRLRRKPFKPDGRFQVQSMPWN
ncbi:MAG: TRAP transporter small permease subunit [Vicinamibacterales bacterium]|jgi:TRAP-type C4-dicarboxylate transport system permease small subunit|nr:TRAP transporter small permease subunit [Vicinamibacterales bacterium]HJO18176.1 TRAP transporter small permease subunit [Vicinamibacterales bacterium]|tara:strand:- start:652 stop:1206 length:555 start_codon:yes stop_codon:yes gene_type:complete